MDPISDQVFNRLEKIADAHLPRATDRLGPSVQSAFVVLQALDMQRRILGL